MPVRSMTGFAQVKSETRSEVGGRASPQSPSPEPSKGRPGFSLSLKSVNHRFLDLHFRLPSGTDALEMQLRRVLKEKIARGHIEVSLSLERATGEPLALNRGLVGGYITAFRSAAAEFGLAADPDLNAILRMPGALDSADESAHGVLEAAVMAKVDEALARLNQMREEEGRSIKRPLRGGMPNLAEAAKCVQQHRGAVLQTYVARVRSRIQELLGSSPDKDRALHGDARLVEPGNI